MAIVPKNIEKYPLTNEAIDTIAGRITTICAERKVDKKLAIKYRLSAEETLLVWQKKLGEEAEVSLNYEEKLMNKNLTLSVPGEKMDPNEAADEEFGTYGNTILATLGLMPVYTYEKRQNIISFDMPKKEINYVLKLLLVVVAALVIAGLLSYLCPAQVIATLDTDIVSPLYDTVFKILSCIAGPMIFLSVASGIYGIGDVDLFGRVGKKMMLFLVGTVVVYTAVGTVFTPFLGISFSNGGANATAISSLVEMILHILPANIFSPFIEGNTLQIIFLAICIGVALIYLGQVTSSIARAINQIELIITYILKLIAKLVPLFVFIVMIHMYWSGVYQSFLTVWKFAIIFLIAEVVMILAFAVYTSFRIGKNPIGLIRDCFPSFLIALTTASSAATLDSNVKIATEKLGIDKSFTSFGIPFGMTMFKPNTALYYMLLCVYFAVTYRVEMSVPWLVVAVIITSIASVSTPPIPGGAATAYTLFFAQLGIPIDVLSIALAIDAIFDFFLTSGDMMVLLFETATIAESTGMRQGIKTK